MTQIQGGTDLAYLRDLLDEVETELFFGGGTVAPLPDGGLREVLAELRDDQAWRIDLKPIGVARLPLSAQMCLAATILEAANRRIGFPPQMAWTARDLRREAPVVASEEQEAAT